MHRDIKPGNVMITSSGQVKVMDFGIARAISDSSATIAQTSAILGTAQYFSPEQARGEAVDARTDLYSTGVVLYELLTGTPAVPRRHRRRGRLPARQRGAGAAERAQPRGLAGAQRGRDARPREGPLRALPDRGRVPRTTSRSPATARCRTTRPRATTSTPTLFGVNPNSTAASEATLRRLADDTDDRPRAPRTARRSPGSGAASPSWP